MFYFVRGKLYNYTPRQVVLRGCRVNSQGEKLKFKSVKAQSILEYTLMLAVVIGILVIVFLNAGGLKDKIGNAYNNTGNALANTTSKLSSSVFGP